MATERMRTIAGFAVISIIWGSTWLAIKIGLESVPPFFAVALRFSLASIVLLLVLRFRKERMPLDRESVSMYATLGFLSFSIPFALVYWGEQYIPSGLASILFAAHPFVVAAGSHLFLPVEPLNPFKVAGILLGFIGVLVIFWADMLLGGISTWGMAAVLLSTLLQGASLIIVKRRNLPISPVSLSLGGMLCSLVVLYALAFLVEDYSSVRFDGRGIGSIVYLATFGSVVTFLIYYWLVKRVEAVFLSLVALLTPILAVLLGALWLRESLSPQVFAGTGLVFAGIVVTNGQDLLRAIRVRANARTAG